MLLLFQQKFSSTVCLLACYRDSYYILYETIQWQHSLSDTILLFNRSNFVLINKRKLLLIWKNKSVKSVNKINLLFQIKHSICELYYHRICHVNLEASKNIYEGRNAKTEHFHKEINFSYCMKNCPCWELNPGSLAYNINLKPLHYLDNNVFI